MSEKRCPSEAELLSFVDADLPPEQLARIEKHLELCSSCAKQVMALTTLVEDVAAPLGEPPLDVAEHLAAVMKRLDSPPALPRFSRFLAWGSALAVAAVALLLFTKLQGAPRATNEAGELVARGGPGQPSLAREIGLKLYAQGPALAPLRSGSRIAADTPLTAGLRNSANERAYLLLFAVDAGQGVHWIAPAYTSAGSDPEAAPIAPSVDERLLPSAAVFDDLQAGPLRVVAVISRTPWHVSDIEALSPAQLTPQGLEKRFPRAEVRQLSLEVAAKP
jgi:anti-sigma factor RsiW